jgi:hypothetical protein
MKSKKQRAMQFVDRAYQAAINYRDKHGYRENLGYDQQNNLEDFMYELDIHISDAGEVINYFYLKMDQV